MTLQIGISAKRPLSLTFKKRHPAHIVTHYLNALEIMSSIIIMMSAIAFVLYLTKDVLQSIALLITLMLFLDLCIISIHYFIQVPHKMIMVGIMGGTISKVIIFLLCQKYLKKK